MKKEQVYFEDTMFLGHEIENIQELVKLFDAGVSIANEDGIEYSLYQYVDFVNDEGDTETKEIELERDELFDLMKRDLENGLKLYAGLSVDYEYDVIPRTLCVMQTDFHIGQEVYTMRDNKVNKATIKQIWLTEGNNSLLSTDTTIHDIFHEYCEMSRVSYNESLFKYAYDKVEHVRVKDKSFAYVVFSDKKSGLVELSELFETKEELLKHLAEE